MELLGPSAAGLFLAGIAVCVRLVLKAGHVRIPDDPPEVDAELHELHRLRFGDTEAEPEPEPEPVTLRPVA